MIIALDIVLLHNDSRGFQILQALQGVTTLRQVLLGIQKQPTSEYLNLSYWLPTNHLSQANPVVYSRTEYLTKQVYYQRSG